MFTSWSARKLEMWWSKINLFIIAIKKCFKKFSKVLICYHEIKRHKPCGMGVACASAPGVKKLVAPPTLGIMFFLLQVSYGYHIDWQWVHWTTKQSCSWMTMWCHSKRYHCDCDNIRLKDARRNIFFLSNGNFWIIIRMVKKLLYFDSSSAHKNKRVFFLLGIIVYSSVSWHRF